jgi:iron(III) transport system ATP-binding protein
MTAIALEHLSKRYGQTTAVDAIDLDISSGRLFFLLGPSGCGKTTLLRMLAGFIDPSDGRILFDGRDVTRLPASKRNVGMVFQSYALWPHMTVADNVAFGLRVRKVRRPERDSRVREALKMVQMEEYARRKPNQLSGGQQQRVALARALVIRPTILLLDEPLSNLDAKLRLEMRLHIREICDAAKITTVYVTHDQKEALSIADEIAILKAGRVVQTGTPRDLYHRPRSMFVSDFLGEANFIPGTVARVEANHVLISTVAGMLRSTQSPAQPLQPRQSVTCSIRPEAIRIVRDSSDENTFRGSRERTFFLGDTTQHIVRVGEKLRVRVLALESSGIADKTSNDMYLRVDARDIIALEA